MVTWKEASITALKDGGPMQVSQIVDRIRELRLRELSGNTPEATVGAQLYLAIQNHDPRVRLVSPGVFEHTGSERPGTIERTLGRLEFINPREIWPDEARHFTPWLLDNAEYLEQVLGIDIELTQSEHPVGSFSLDLYGRDITNGCDLIVENQLEQTDHRHLGQLLTYAAGTDALTVVWVAPSFRDEHRDVLEYLNRISTGEARFFGVKLRVAVIGDSDAAPDFELVAEPSEWRGQVRSQRGQPGGELSERSAAYLEFWSSYLERLHSEHPGTTNVRAAQPQNWMNLNFARRFVFAGVFANSGQLRCEVYIDVGDSDANQRLFEAVRTHQSKIEESIGAPLHWDNLDGRRACRISITTPGRVTDNNIDAHIKWLMEHHLKFRLAFLPVINALPSSLWEQ